MYRKFTATHIFNGYQFVQQQVLITDAAGIVVDIAEEENAGDGIEKLHGILCPGFINAHCHLELSHLKGTIPKQTGLVDFVLSIISKRQTNEDLIIPAIEKAEQEMLQYGIVAVGDICNNNLTLSQKLKHKLRYHNFIEVSGFPPAVATERFNKAVDIYKSFNAQMPACSIVAHAPYSVSPALFKMIDDFSGNNLLSIHNQESETENEFFKTGQGDILQLCQQLGIDISFFKPSKKSSLQTWLPNFTKGKQVIMVHNVCTNEVDIEFAKKQPTWFCLCPNANLYISNRLPNVNMLMKHTDKIVIGTDSLASNNQLSILEEIKTLQKNFTDLNLSTLLQWATSNAAKALQMNSSLGSFEKGKQPGIVLIEGVEGLTVTDNTTSKRIL
ncbi:MAG: amidohydrolase family protein [Ferruginibacter sp.]|nr:amidohydrolase family protein [Ferruginibacter sp.]